MEAKVPTCPEEVTKPWLREVLTKSMSSPVEILSLDTLKEVNGFLSGVLKATIEVKDKKEDIIIKVIPGQDAPFRSFFDESNFDELEVNFYKDLLPCLVAFEKSIKNGTSDLEKISPKFYSGEVNLDISNRGFYLILEDLSTSGHELKKNPEGLNIDQMKDVLKKIAKFHAIAYAFKLENEEKVKTWKIPSWYEIFIKDETVKDLYEAGFRLLKEDLKLTDPDLVQPLEKLEPKWLEAYTSKVCVKDERFISHGDLWINNVMFDKSHNGQIIDWQLMAHDHPIMDIGLFLCTSLTPRNIEQWAQDLLRHYTEEFQKTCELFKVESPFDFNELQDLFYQKGIMLTFLIWLQGYGEIVQPRDDFKERLKWQLRECIKRTPELFE